MAVSPFRLLVRAFFDRFFDSELVSSAIELRQALIFLLAFLAVPGILLSVGLINQYIYVSHRLPWMLERFSWPHKLFFITYSMLVVGVAAVVVWESLTVDRRDAMILGPLPLGGRTIVSAKLAALLIFLLILAVGVNAASACAFAFNFGEIHAVAIVVRVGDARALGLRTIGDAAREAPHLRAAFPDVFRNDPDGYPRLVAAYGLRFPAPPLAMDAATIEQQLAAGRVDLILSDAPARWLATLDLVRLADDRHYFSPYGQGAVPFVRAMVAQLFATVSAAAWVFTTLIVLKAALILLPRRYRNALTIAFQALFVVLLFSLLVLMPIALRAIANALSATGGSGGAVWLLPPAWFLGLYETLVGSSRPIFHRLALIAIGVMAVSALSAVFAIAAALRWELRYAVEAAVVPSAAGSLLIRARAFLLQTIARTPATHAVLTFTMISMARSRKHQLLVAAYAGAGLALVLVVLARGAARGGLASLAHPRVAVLWIPLVLILWLLIGVRAAFRMPTELAAGWTFQINASAPASVYAPAARAAAALLVLVPVLASSLVVYTWLLGWRIAIVHVTFCGLMGAALLEVLLARFDQIPFTRAYEAGPAKVRVWWPIYLIALEAYAHWPVNVELWMLQEPQRMLATLGLMAAALVVLRWQCRRWLPPTRPLNFEVVPERPLSLLELSG